MILTLLIIDLHLVQQVAPFRSVGLQLLWRDVLDKLLELNLGHVTPSCVLFVVVIVIAQVLIVFTVLSGVLITIDKVGVLTHDGQSHDPGIVRLLFFLLTQSLAHDGDQHVHEHNLDQVCGHDKQYVDEDNIQRRRSWVSLTCRVRIVGVNRELSEAQLVHGREGIKEPEVEDWRDPLVLSTHPTASVQAH